MNVTEYLGVAGGGFILYESAIYAQKRLSGKMRSGGSSSSSFTVNGKIERRLDYSKIANLEIDIYKQTQPCAGSPYKAGFKTIAGAVSGHEYTIDSTGHDSLGQCNFNASLGKPCQWAGHHPRTSRDPDRKVSSVPVSYDPDWTDEDGRPW